MKFPKEWWKEAKVGIKFPAWCTLVSVKNKAKKLGFSNENKIGEVTWIEPKTSHVKDTKNVKGENGVKGNRTRVATVIREKEMKMGLGEIKIGYWLDKERTNNWSK